MITASIHFQMGLVVAHHGEKSRTLDCTEAEYRAGKARYDSGRMIQEAFGFLSLDDREFMQSGLTPEEYQTMCEHAEDMEGESEAHQKDEESRERDDEAIIDMEREDVAKAMDRAMFDDKLGGGEQDD